MIERKINFNQIEDRVVAARKLQEAGQQEKSEEVLKALAVDILEKIK